MWRTKTRHTIGGVRLGLAAACLLLAGVVRAADFVGSTTTGSTGITPGSCSANIVKRVNTPLDVSVGDVVHLWYNVTWSDTRDSNSNDASHYFNLTVSYYRESGDYWADHTVVTNGGIPSGGPYSMAINVTVQQGYSYVGLQWVAQVTNSICSPNPKRAYDSDVITLII